MFGSIATQAQTLINLTKKKKKTSKTKLLTITSGKGGVGKSTLTANLSYLLAQKGLKVLVLDADIGLANMQVLFNVKPEKTLFDYVEGKAKVENILTHTPYKGVSLIAGKSGIEYVKNKNSFIFTRVIHDVLEMNYFDIMLIDTGAGLNEHVKEFIDISENVLAVTTPDPSALTDVYALIKMLSSNKDKLMLCFNHTNKYKIGETISASLVNLARKNRLNDKFMVEYIGNVSSSTQVSTTGRLKKLFVKEFLGDDVVVEFNDIADKILNSIGK